MFSQELNLLLLDLWNGDRSYVDTAMVEIPKLIEKHITRKLDANEKLSITNFLMGLRISQPATLERRELHDRLHKYVKELKTGDKVPDFRNN